MANELILVVEDSRTQRQALEMYLLKEGFKVITAEDGIEGYYMVITESPDIIVSDINLPELNGYQFCRLLKNEETTSSIPIILLTSLGQKEDRFWGIKAGAERYILKDTPIDDLIKEINVLLKEKKHKNKKKEESKGGAIYYLVKTEDRVSRQLLLTEGEAKDATIMSKVNVLFDKLLREATIMGDIKNLTAYITNRPAFIKEFFNIMTDLFDFKAAGLLIISNESPILYLKTEGWVLEGEKIAAIKEVCLRGLGEKWTGDIKVEIINSEGSGEKIAAMPFSLVNSLNIQKELIGNISLFDDKEYNINNKNTLSIIGKDLAVIIKLMLLYEENESLSITDGLTKVYNRRYFEKHIESEFEKAKRYTSKLSLIMLDIDHFKSLNDNYGHQQGDLVLIHIGKLLKESVRNIDFIVRYGGEEFAILMPGIGKGEGAVAAEKIRKIIEQYPFPPIQKGGEPIKLTISLGVAEYDNGMRLYDNLIKSADDALYKAKEDGRNMVRVHK
ncbi:MAG: diguanylate cyclase [Nitrospirae bacterium]|nr:diguanylate cyclase [Nitrospirota bacterium]